MDDRERCLARAVKIMQSRANYWDKHHVMNRSSAYSSCADILQYAMAGDWDALNQFDDYEEGELL